MGKTKNQPDNKRSEKVIQKPSSSHGVEKTNAAKSIGAQLHSIALPKSADGLTADQLTEDQKIVFKKECQKLYGHKYVEKRQLPAYSLEKATSQLEIKLKEKLQQKKLEKKMKKQQNS